MKKQDFEAILKQAKDNGMYVYFNGQCLSVSALDWNEEGLEPEYNGKQFSFYAMETGEKVTVNVADIQDIEID